MPTFDFKCDKCDFVNEYNTNVPSMLPPKFCPKCKIGKLEKQFSPQGQSFDVIGGFEYTYGGKKNWKSRMNAADQASVLTGEKNPY
jgi:putative FmdB family regulatory protein